MDDDYRTIATVITMAEDAHRVLDNFNTYYRVSGYPEADEIANALEWLECTVRKFENLSH